MKRFFSAFLSLGMSALMLCGCSTPSNKKKREPAAPVTVETYGSYWMNNHDYKTMPIGAYNSCPPRLNGYTHDYLASERTFIDYADAGVNTVMGLYDYAGTYNGEVLRALDWCLENGLSYLVAYADAIDAADPSAVRSALSQIRNHEAFGGVMLADEPGFVMFDRAARARDSFRAAMPEGGEDRLWHANLFPTYADSERLYFKFPKEGDTVPGGTYSYARYLDDFVRIYRPQVLSYDNYPINGPFPSLRGDYFENMGLIRRKALETNIPFWVYVQTCNFYRGQRLPNAEELNWNVNTALAYGAKGIQYFTGVLPIDDGGEVFGGAMFDRDGNKTPIYDYVQNANRQIAAVDEVLMCAKSKGVVCAGVAPMAGKTRMNLPADDLIASYRELTGVRAAHSIVGCFDYNGKTALYVVNNAIADDADIGTEKIDTVTLTFSSAVSGYRIRSGVKSTFKGNCLTLEMNAGDGVLVVLE